MRASSLASVGWMVTVLLVAGALILGLANRQVAPLYEVTSVVISPTFAALGALIVSRRPGNVTGWIFLASGLLGGVLMFFGQYATVALASQGLALPGAALAAWLATLAQNSFSVSILFLVLLFPDGRLPSRRWRPLARVMGTFIAVSLAVVASSPGPLAEFPSASNPFGVEVATLPGPVSAAGQLGVMACVVAALLSMVVRFYRSRGEERLQLKWFTYAAMVGVTTPLLLGVLALAAFEVLGRLVWTLGFLSIPVSAAVAILKYRLYKIDAIINRTLVYGALTLMLASLYFGGVVVLQYALRATTGQESSLAVVASTFAIAALFNPLRRRVQSFVDRRFYRRKYDAGRVLEAHAAGLRDVTDLAALCEDLIGVVAETVRPAHVSLWLRKAGLRSPGTAALSGGVVGEGRSVEGTAGAASGEGPQSRGGEP
ncbi:MAG TPA: hypothetical protein VGV91_12790 [Rubrobacter sp.]|nr:hypothetical protein [Rubrobacter sp.]